MVAKDYLKWGFWQASGGNHIHKKWITAQAVQ